MNIQETKLFIAAADMCGQVPLIEGKHGIGKSDIVKQYAKENDMHCEVLLLSLLDTADLIGIPRTVSIGGQATTVWAAPSWFNRIIDAAWPVHLKMEDLVFHNKAFEAYLVKSYKNEISREELNAAYCQFKHISNSGLVIHVQSDVSYKYSKRSALFLDEFNRAPLDILNASLQLILDKRLNDHQLPIVNGLPTFVIAAINPSNGDYTTNELDPALKDRFIHCVAEPDAKSWLEWARTNELAPVVRDFISEHPNRIHHTSKDGNTSATPRSWTALAKVMSNIEKLPHEIHYNLMEGLIGQDLASQFLSYYNNYFKVIKIEEVEAAIEKAHKKSKSVEEIGKIVAKLLKDQEVVQKSELAEQFYEKYKSAENDAKFPLLAFLYGLELELLAWFLKTKKSSDVAGFKALMEYDDTLTGKALVRRVIGKLSQG